MASWTIRSRVGAAAALCLSACCPYAGAQKGMLASMDPPAMVAARTPSASPTEAVPQPARLGPSGCYGALRSEGVTHTTLHGRNTRAVAMPVRLGGPLNGVTFRALNGSATHEVMDCRLAVALAEWSRELHKLGVTEVEHFSAYRPGAVVAGTKKASGHSRAMAVDAARFHLRDGRVIDVKRDWAGRERGGPVCPVRRREPEDAELLRRAVCDAVSMGIFQVILTPHHDQAHHNHIHMELVPDVDWTYIR